MLFTAQLYALFFNPSTTTALQCKAPTLSTSPFSIILREKIESLKAFEAQ